MKIIFVCTGNICRSPMGELLMAKYLEGTSLEITSAGTHGLIDHPIDPSSGKLMESVGINPTGFRSKRLTKAMAESADLILTFEREQRREVAELAPFSARRTFPIIDFMNLSNYCKAGRIVTGDTVQARLQSIIEHAPLARIHLPAPVDIEDPHRKSFDVFERAAFQTNNALFQILQNIKR